MMKTIQNKKLLMLLGIILAIGILGAGFSFAAVLSEDGTTSDEAATEDATDKVLPPRVNLPEQAATLTEEQKAELFAIQDQIEALRGSMLDKMVEFGALDQETADAMKEFQAARYEEMNETGVIFGGPGRGPDGRGRGGRGPRGGMPMFGNGEAPCVTTPPAIEATDSN
jgi:hypothetical protein